VLCHTAAIELVMILEALMVQHSRLKRELASAYQSESWNESQIDWLVDQLYAIEREITAIQQGDEDFGDTDSGFIYQSVLRE
jgi:tRNA(Glu) U13 pseudouridine synthase TruD